MDLIIEVRIEIEIIIEIIIIEIIEKGIKVVIIEDRSRLNLRIFDFKIGYV
jgi:hypothetical protein